MLHTLLIGFLATTPTLPLVVQQGDLEVSFFPRSPDQMTAFYSARKFPDAMLDILGKQCFMTVRVHNQGKDKIWLDMGQWQFSYNGKPLPRRHRNAWLQQWSDMQMPQAKISTFRWTLIPEQLDYLPGEQEGGNIILPRVKGPITLTAVFATGDDQQGQPVTLKYDGLFCAENVP